MDDETAAEPAETPASESGAVAAPDQPEQADGESPTTVDVEVDGLGCGQAVVQVVAFDVVDATASDGSPVSWDVGPTTESTVVRIEGGETKDGTVTVTLEVERGGK